MIVYRLSKERFKNDLSGKGAEIAGGRWNNKGFAVLYTSESRALCTTEIAVHTPLGILPDDFYLITIEFPDDVEIKEIKATQLSSSWKNIPHTHETQRMGNKFIKEEKYLIMKVPSAVVQGDYNYLINPAHKDFDKVKIKKTEKFEFDKRLFK